MARDTDDILARKLLALIARGQAQVKIEGRSLRVTLGGQTATSDLHQPQVVSRDGVRYR